MAYCDTLYRDLKKGLEGLVLESLLHLIYLTTPYDLAAQSEPDWMVYFRQVREQVSWAETSLYVSRDLVEHLELGLLSFRVSFSSLFRLLYMSCTKLWVLLHSHKCICVFQVLKNIYLCVCVCSGGVHVCT